MNLSRWKSSRGEVGIPLISFIIAASVALIYFHYNIVPLDMAAKMLLAWDPDKTVWKARIKQESLGDMGSKHTAWARTNNGSTFEESRAMQHFLWDQWDTWLPMFLFAAVLLAAAILFIGGRKDSRRHRRYY